MGLLLMLCTLKRVRLQRPGLILCTPAPPPSSGQLKVLMLPLARSRGLLTFTIRGSSKATQSRNRPISNPNIASLRTGALYQETGGHHLLGGPAPPTGLHVLRHSEGLRQLEKRWETNLGILSVQCEKQRFMEHPRYPQQRQA